MRKISAVATFLAIGLGVASNASAQLALKGSDTLEFVTKRVITSCPGASAVISYVGGGSGAGEAAMTGGTQNISPMSRELNGRNGVDGVKCKAGSQQLLLGLDGIAVVGANQINGDSEALTASTADDCSDNVTGGATVTCTANVDGCDATGHYTFNNWQDVLAEVYGGQNHTGAAQLMAGGTVAGQKVRNPARINCASDVRVNLVNSWGTLFTDVSPSHSCRTGACTRLQHAFRRDDLSGTTDTFVTLVGLVALPNLTKACIAGTSGIPDNAATASAFCNAGNAPMNKGDSDYLDLDPIRRPAHRLTGATGPGLEELAQGFTVGNGLPANTDAQCGTPAANANLQDHSLATGPGVIATTANQPALAADLLARTCLGLVLPISVPANLSTVQQLFYSDTRQSGLNGDPVCPTAGRLRCTPGAFVAKAPPTGGICPDGTTGLCNLPVNLLNPSDPNSTADFNCLSESFTANPPIKDARVFNLIPKSTTGTYLKDNFVNPNLVNPVADPAQCTAQVSAAKQARIVTAFYRLHTNRATDLTNMPVAATAPPTQGSSGRGTNACAGDNTVCRLTSSTEQIGCLAKASACSIGFAGREAVTKDGSGNPLGNMAFRIADNHPTTLNIQNLVTGGTPVYKISRTLWVNSENGFGSLPAGGPEATLMSTNAGCYSDPAAVNSAISLENFVTLPGPGLGFDTTAQRTFSCPSPFPLPAP